jgi:hypothetical protein
VEAKLSIIVSFILGLALGYLLLLSGIWYLVILGGAIVGLLISGRWLHQFLTLFVAGVASTLIYTYPLFRDGLPKLMYVVGVIAGINGNILLLLMMVISGAMSGAGGLIGSSIREAVRGRGRTTHIVGGHEPEAHT